MRTFSSPSLTVSFSLVSVFVYENKIIIRSGSVFCGGRLRGVEHEKMSVLRGGSAG